MRVWDLKNPESLSVIWEAMLEHGQDGIDRDDLFYTPVAFSPTDDILAFLDDKVEVVRLMDFGTTHEERLEGHTAFVTAIAFSPDGTLLATASHDGTCRIWNVRDRAEPRVFSSPGDKLWSVVFSPDGNSVAAGTDSGVINIWRLDSERSDKLVCTMVRSNAGRYPEEADNLWQLAYSPDGTLLAAACADMTIKLWNVTRREQRLLAGHTDQVRGVVFTEKGDMLVSGGRDGAIKVWRVVDLREIRSLPGLPGQRLAIYGARVATAAGENAFRIWTTHTTSHTLFDIPIYKMAVSSRGKLAALTRDHRVLCYDITKNAGDPMLARNTQFPASCLAFAEDGSQLAVGRVDGQVELWDMTTGQCLRQYPIASERLFHVFLTGDQLIGAVSHTITICDLSSMVVGRQIPVDVPPRVLAFSPEARRLACFAQNGRIAVVGLDNPVSEPDYHAMAGVMSFRFIDQGKTLVSTNWHGQIGFWSVEPFQHRMDIVQTPRRVACSAVSPDGRTLVTGGEEYIRRYRAE